MTKWCRSGVRLAAPGLSLRNDSCAGGRSAGAPKRRDVPPLDTPRGCDERGGVRLVPYKAQPPTLVLRLEQGPPVYGFRRDRHKCLVVSITSRSRACLRHRVTPHSFQLWRSPRLSNLQPQDIKGRKRVNSLMAKYSATEARYRPAVPGAKRRCSNCLNYQEAESRCTRVGGTIKPNVVCSLWKLKTPPIVDLVCN